ncbi:energy transducer TonB [Sulfurospirillum arcachonense]|uniref:energy transducer TonB n=1 Tax=Sulfurospirillum arcachonense TaxID=57666 RepID=UPI00046A74BC|nr:energy transducer TonB [Sulfurospirillum arcachonense]
MFTKIILLLSFIFILFGHFALFTLFKFEDKKTVVAQKNTATSISVRKVSLQKKVHKKIEPKKEIKKEVKKVVKTKKVKKIVKKAKRKVPKKIVKKTKKIPIKRVEKVQKVIKKITPKLTPTVTRKITPIVKKRLVVSNATKNMIENEYLLRLRHLIEKNKIYPKRAKRLKQQGEVVVSFEILKDGSIKRVNIKNRSSFKRLNMAAVKLLKKINKFDSIPNELEKNRWAIEIPIKYSIVNI